jgi:uncharacterized protein YqeY
MLKQQLQDELKQSMLARDELKTSTLRMLLSAISYAEIQKGGAGYEASDEDVLAVIQKEAKQRRDSIEAFETNGRQEMAEKEKKELAILQKYLPEQMNEDAIRTLVTVAVSQTGAVGMQDIGKVMGFLMPRVKGKADGNLVNKIVREKLTA